MDSLHEDQRARLLAYLRQHRYVIHDRDICQEFWETTASAKCLRLSPRSPNLNDFAERWVRSVKEECLSKLIQFGKIIEESSPNFQEHYTAGPHKFLAIRESKRYSYRQPVKTCSPKPAK
jgi:hypothetical protein